MDEAANLAGDAMGGGGAAGNEALANGGGTGTGNQPAAWTSQLSRDFRDNNESFEKVSGFNTITELANAYLEADGAEMDDETLFRRLGIPAPDEPYGIEGQLDESMGDFLQHARDANLTKAQAAKLADAYRTMLGNALKVVPEEVKKAVEENAKSLVNEFGADARSWWNKAAASENGLRQAFAKAGLGKSKTLMRALTLLGREMTEESTPSGSTHGTATPKAWGEGGVFDFNFLEK
jgi:hypothetical protein